MARSWLYALAVLGIVILIPWCARASQLVNPDATTMYLLQYLFSHTAPPFGVLADNDAAVRAADEFHRNDVRTRTETQLKTKASALVGVTTLQVNLSTRFSEYDSQDQEYDFEINDGSYIPYKAFGDEVHLALTNGTEAQVWKVDQKSAEAILRKSGSWRGVTLALTLMLLDSPPPVNGSPLVLNAKIIKYDILTNSGRLGTVVVSGNH